VNVTFDFANPTNLVIAGVFILIILGVLYRILTSVDGSVGPFKWRRKQEEREETGNSNEYLMNRDNQRHDEDFQDRCRDLTDELTPISKNMLRGYKLCAVARKAIAQTLNNTLYDAISRNHFTYKLSKDVVVRYKKQLVERSLRKYCRFVEDYASEPCNLIELPSQDVIEKYLTNMVEVWIKDIAQEVIKTCPQKIATYQEYLPMFKAQNDKKRVKIVEDCIRKNEGYIDDFSRRYSL
jgi:5'(3')-deoxyribonucleotidase